MKNAVAHAPIYTQYTCTHTSKYMIMHAHEVSEVPMTSPNHALQYCHVIMYVYLIINYKQVRPSAALASLRTLRPAYGRPQRAQCFNL